MRPQRAGAGRGDRGRRHEGAGQRQPQREPRLRAARARDRRGGDRDRRGRGRALRRARAATSCRRSSPRARGGAAGCARPRSAWRPSARRIRSRCRATAPSASSRPSAAWTRSSGPRSAPTPPTRPGGRAASPRTDRGAWRPARPSPTRRRRVPEGRINLTDPDSKVVKGLRGWIQGYNAQAVTNEHQIVLAAEIETVGADFGHLEPMLDAAQHELARRRRHRHARGGARRRRLLARRTDATHHRPRHPGADPARHQPQANHPAQLGRRPLRRDARRCWPPSAAASSTANASR